MKKFYKADPKNGIAAYWQVGSDGAVKIETEQFENRSGLSMKVTASDGVVAVETFGKDGFVAIALPVGTWSWERSDDGRNWREVTKLDSFQLKTGPSQVVNLTLDGQTPYPRIWGRFTKIIPKAARVPVPPAQKAKARA